MNEAIVVLGNENDENGVLRSIPRERCEQAIAEYQKRSGAKIIPTGGWGHYFNTTARPHAAYLREYLVGRGVPEAIVEGAESANTVEDAKLCRPIVDRHGFRRLVLVTSDFHLERAQFLFTREFPDVALEFVAAKTHLPEAELRRRVEHEQRALAKLRARAVHDDPSRGRERSTSTS